MFNSENYTRTSIWFLISCLSANYAYAASTDDIVIHGFGTIGYSLLLNSSGGEVFDRTSFAYTPQKTKKYIGVTKKGTFSRDSKFGLNFDVPLDKNKIALTAQLFSEAADQITGEPQYFSTRLSVFNLRYEPFDGTTIRFGLIPTPNWLISEEKLVGYTYPMIRNPTEVDAALKYGDTLQGISVSQNVSFGGLVIRPTLTAGYTPADVGFKGRDRVIVDSSTMIANLRFEYESFLYAIGYQKYSGNAEVDNHISVNQGGQNVLFNSPIRLDYDADQLVTDIKLESRNVLLMAEFIALDTHIRDSPVPGFSGITNTARGGYVLLGIPIGEWLPRVGFSQHTVRSKVPDKSISSFLDAFVDQNPSIPDASKPFVRQNLSTLGDKLMTDTFQLEYVQKTVTLGLNYQYSVNILLKAEIQRAEAPTDASSGLLGLNRGGKVDLASTTLDFVF